MPPRSDLIERNLPALLLFVDNPPSVQTDTS